MNSESEKSFKNSITKANRVLWAIAGAKNVLGCEDDWATPEKLRTYYQEVFAKELGDITIEEIEDAMCEFGWLLALRQKDIINGSPPYAARFVMTHELAIKALLRKNEAKQLSP